MKTLNGMKFGFATVNAGQRNVSDEPQVIVTSTDGGFRITPLVSQTLGLRHGDYVMFLSNVANIDIAINDQAPEVVQFCEEQGLEVGSAEAAIALHKEFDMFAIAKGILEYDAKGNQKMTNERLTKKDKITFATQHFDEMMEKAMAEANDEVKDALTRDNISKEEQIEILSAFVVARETPKYRGSKTANSAGLTGIGASLTFTDSNIWKQLKADMGENADKLNRVFDVDIKNVQTISVFNGFEEVNVKAVILGEYADKQPIRTKKGKDEEVEE